jgi:hypothetical protein
MRRREFIAVLAGAAGAWPRDALAQQSAIPVTDTSHPFSRLRFKFASDSPLEGDGFELPVPGEKKSRNLGIPLEFN